jgi:hypothetical protein
MGQDHFVSLSRRGSLANAKRQKKVSVSVMEELQRVLGTEVDLESAMEDSPHLPYDFDHTTALMCNSPSFKMDPVLATPPTTQDVGVVHIVSSDANARRCPPSLPLPPPPPPASRTPAAASKRHAISIQLPPKSRAPRSRSCTVTSVPGEDSRSPTSATTNHDSIIRRARTHAKTPSMSGSKASRDRAGSCSSRPTTAKSFDGDLRITAEQQRIQLERVTQELKLTRASHESERRVLSQRIEQLEREARQKDRENAELWQLFQRATTDLNEHSPLTDFASHFREDTAKSTASQYSVESMIVGVQREFNNFLSTTPCFAQGDRRVSVIGVPDEHRPPLREVTDARRQSSPVILGGHFPPLSEVLNATDPLAALVEFEDLVAASASLPSLASSSTVSLGLSSIAESPVLPVVSQLMPTRKASVRALKVRPVMMVDPDEGEDLPPSWGVDANDF